MASAPKPFIFQSKEQLRAEVGSRLNRKAYKDFFSQDFQDLGEVVKESVASNTFRAFHWKKHNIGDTPSRFYRRWTNALLSKSYPAFLGCSDPKDYQTLLIQSAKRLVKDWDKTTSGLHQLQFGQAAKLLNLSFKHALLFGSKVDSENRERLCQFLDIPLDSFTLRGVMKLCPNFGIPNSATMSFVKSEIHYKALQKAIRDLCASTVGLPPIYYEIRA